MSLPNVIGTGLGVKRRDGRRVSNAAVIVFVRQKLPSELLPKAQRIPDYLRHGNAQVPTDVVPISGIREEFGEAPYFISDRAKKGTVTAFARIEDSLHAVSCAHCLRGRDGNPHTTEPIDFWDAGLARYVPGGENVFAVSAPGYGRPGNFGFSDAGLVRLEHRELLRRARDAPALTFRDAVRRGLKVAGQGPRSTIIGEVDAVEAIIDRRRVDVVVFMPGEGTVPGNSGMLWRTSDGAAVAIHALGVYADEGSESRYSLAMEARRIANELQVDFLDTGWRSSP